MIACRLALSFEGLQDGLQSANIGMADDMSLLLVPRDIITQVHKFLHQFPALVTCTRLSTRVSIEETMTNDSWGLVSARLRSCYSMR